MQKTKKKTKHQSKETPQERYATKRTAQKDETRKKILDAGRKIIAEKGFKETNVADIAKEINMAHGTVYYHFRDKKTLLIELLKESFEELFTMTSSWSKSTETNPESFTSFMHAIAQFIYDNRETGLIIRNESYNPDPDISGTIHNAFEKLCSHTENALALGMKLGAVRTMNARLIGIAIVGMVKEMLYYALDHPDMFELDEIVEELNNQINSGIRGPAAHS